MPKKAKKHAAKKTSVKRAKIHAEVIRAPKADQAGKAPPAKTGTDNAGEAVAEAVVDATAPAARKAAKAPKTSKETAPRKPGILALAADILAKAKKAMTAKEIVEHALENKMWETNGKTPGATLYSAMLRDMAKRGSESRFLRAEKKGQFCTSGR